MTRLSYQSRIIIETESRGPIVVSYTKYWAVTARSNSTNFTLKALSLNCHWRWPPFWHPLCDNKWRAAVVSSSFKLFDATRDVWLCTLQYPMAQQGCGSWIVPAIPLLADEMSSNPPRRVWKKRCCMAPVVFSSFCDHFPILQCTEA